MNKKILSVLLAVAVTLTWSIPVFATDTPPESFSPAGTRAEVSSRTDAPPESSSPKEEIVYGILAADGSVRNVYVVNRFSGGSIVDYGRYTKIVNMTSSEPLTQNDDRITVDSTADRFVYQGTAESKELPWNISVVYRLDGNERAAADIAGKTGALEIIVSVTANDAVNAVFFENYALQVSMSFDEDICSDIFSEGATPARAGNHTLISHTVLPGNDAVLSVTANVRNFSMSGIEFAGVPLSMDVDIPDTDGINDDLTLLTDAIADLNEGMRLLADGLSASSAGARKLTAGSSDYSDGLSALLEESGNLLDASAQIKASLTEISAGLESGGDDAYDLSDLAELPGALRQLAAGLDEVSSGISDLSDGYNTAFPMLDAAIATIPEADVDATALYGAVAGNAELTASLDQLMAYYAAAVTVRGTYAETRDAFLSVCGGLDSLSASVDTISVTLSGMADSIEESLQDLNITDTLASLSDGISLLSTSYDQFHTGLGDYTDGVQGLSDGYAEIHTGIRSFANGTSSLRDGAEELADGTDTLDRELADLPDLLVDEIEELTQYYDRSDFVPVSFASSKNTRVTFVQFIMKTAPVTMSEPADEQTTAPAPSTFWQKLLDLFGI
ncbi:MAG: hypothetical protein JW817_01075 [Clostridiales bacterium]|nr:hypothetical protein [Clostridiales bacterium]